MEKEEFEEMLRRFEDMWRGRRPDLTNLNSIPEYKKPSIDLADTDKYIVAIVEIPGLEKEDIKICVTENNLEISAEKKLEDYKECRGYLFREIRNRKYYRSLALPIMVDPENVEASYKNGIVEIRMSKTETSKKKLVKID